MEILIGLTNENTHKHYLGQMGSISAHAVASILAWSLRNYPYWPYWFRTGSADACFHKTVRWFSFCDFWSLTGRLKDIAGGTPRGFAHTGSILGFYYVKVHSDPCSKHVSYHSHMFWSLQDDRYRSSYNSHMFFVFLFFVVFFLFFGRNPILGTQRYLQSTVLPKNTRKTKQNHIFAVKTQ